GESLNKVADGYKITDGSGTDVTSGTNITCIDGTLTVTVRTVLVRSESDVKEYDGKPLTNSNWSATGLAEGDSEDSIRVQVSGSQTDCGTSPNTISCEWAANPGFKTENYKLTALPGTLEVQENTSLITIWPDRLKKPYDGQPFSPLTYHVTGLPGGFSVQATVESEDPGWSEVGSVWVWIGDDYAIINDATGKDVTKFFEYVALPEVELVIERAPVTVKADNKYKTVGDEDPALTATVTGLVNGEAVKYDLSRAEGERVGRYTITPSGEELQGSHYIVTYETGTFTITSASNGGGGTPVTPDDPLIYTITYDDGTSTVTEQYPEGTVVSLTRTPVRDGYRFTGWYADPQHTERVTRITVGEDMTLYAGWEELHVDQTRTVTFDDGTKQTTRQVEAGTTIRLTETPEREGYRFTGWYTDPEKTHRVTRVKVDDDITLYAGWEKIDNGGSNDNNGGNNNGTPGNNSGSKGRTGRTVTPSSGSGNGGGTNVAPGGSGGSDGSGGTDIKDDDTPKTDGKDDGTKIDDDDVPKAWDDGQWALMNLVLAILAALLGAGTLAGWFRRKHEDRLVGLVSAITAIAVFLVTEDMSQPMCMADKWTPLMALIVGAAAAAAFVPGSEKKRKSR
ncbi:MAG: InlB B-repeat-containing protein, partial [Firmicutes bacterium]|nr:InlB B-repeat-containing protein [Bacillota bacterium]